MQQREVVRQRMLTLEGLLATPGGPFGEKGGPLAERMRAGWEAERRLLGRILDDTQGDDVRATIGRWHERTAAFLDTAEEERPSWRDRQGNVWDAREVVRLLDDFGRRLEAWLDHGGDGEGGNAPPVVGAGERAQRSPGAARRDEGAPGVGARVAPAGRGERSDAGHHLEDEHGLGDLVGMDDEDDDEDDDARYVSVLGDGGDGG